jgi:hypothetical protein
MTLSKNTESRRAENKAADLGHCGAGEIQESFDHLLQRGVDNHPHLR